VEIATQAESPEPQFGSSVDRYVPFLPAAIAVILCLPVLSFTYLWDDYNFLTNAMFYQLHDWVPDPSDPFYRPISRGIYFTMLDLAGRHGALLGHLLNLSFLVAILLLLGSFVTRLAGRKAGLLSGLILAGLGAVPLLVGWICCDQDLLAMLFVVIALHFRLQRRNGLALAAAAAGLLSKETTLAVIPALVLFDWIVGRKPHRIWRSAGIYAALVAVWGSIHPAVRILVARGLRRGATGYVGLGQPEVWPVHLGRYLLTGFNLPAITPLPEWPIFGVLLLIVAFAIAYVALRSATQGPRTGEETATTRRSRIVLLGAFLVAGPLLLTSTMIEGWSPYYAAFPALGISMIGGVLLATHSIRVQAIALAVYFALGIWTRGPVKKLTEVTESNFQIVDTALRKVEGGFRKLYPTFPKGTQVALSVEARGAGSVYMHMYAFQVLRVWYRDRSIYCVRPEARRSAGNPELLTVIAPDRDIIDINPVTLVARSASGREPDYEVCERAVRAFAMGLAGSGATDAAVSMLLHMPEVSVGLASVHRRMAAMFLLADGREHEAQTIIDSTVVLPRGVAIADLFAVLAEHPPDRTYDDSAMRAFAIRPNDADATRQLMKSFADNKYTESALRFAQRLQALKPGDPEATDVIRRMTALIEERRRIPPNAGAVE
jgi:hypothetical protein